MAGHESTMPFIKNLASSDRKDRTSALSSLHTFLSAREAVSGLTPVDVLKLWKGLFYALWMCDRPLPQQALCADLAGLVDVLPPAAVVPWLRGFWATMAREWAGVDVLRLNKFLLLVRRVLGASLRWMRVAGALGAGRAWDRHRVAAMLALLEEWPLSPAADVRAHGESGRQGGSLASSTAPVSVPVGLRLHVLDIWVDEAEKTGLLEGDEEGQEILRRLVGMVDALEQKTDSRAVRVRAKDSLTDARLSGEPARARHDSDADDGERADGRDRDGDGDGDGSWDGFED